MELKDYPEVSNEQWKDYYDNSDEETKKKMDEFLATLRYPINASLLTHIVKNAFNQCLMNQFFYNLTKNE